MQHERLPNGDIGIRMSYGGEELLATPVQLLSMLLVQLKSVAESNLKGKVFDCVISVRVGSRHRADAVFRAH